MKDYKFEILQNVLSLLHKAGNKRILNAKTAKDFAIPTVQISEYTRLMTRLYSVATEHEDAYWAIPMDTVKVSKKHAELRDAWNELLKCSSDSLVKIKPTETDIGRIASYASKFTASAANFDLADKWACPKTTKDTTPSEFQRNVETLIGIRVDEIARLTENESEYLNDANTLASTIKSNEKKIKEKRESVSAMKAELEAESELAVKNYIQKSIAKMEEEIAKMEGANNTARINLNKIREMTPDEYAGMKEEQEKAEIERRRAERKAKRKAKQSEQNHETEQGNATEQQ